MANSMMWHDVAWHEQIESCRNATTTKCTAITDESEHVVNRKNACQHAIHVRNA